MRLLLKLALLCCALFLGQCLVGGVRGPYIWGPTSGNQGDTLVFSVLGADSYGRSNRFKLSWGDGTSDGWTELYPYGDTVDIQHVYNKTGRFTISALARSSSGGESPEPSTFEVLVTP